MINVLRFIGAIDKDGKQTDKAANIFYQTDADFQKGFEDMIKTSYADLFGAYKDATWSLSSDKLIAFFRSKDRTTALVGKLQASTFQLLASFAGHDTPPEPGTAKKEADKLKVIKSKPQPPKRDSGASLPPDNGRNRDFGLTVRIEVNLPPSGDQDTYDKIFRSIRENLLNVPKP